MMPQAESKIAATWSETGHVHIWDLSEHFQSLSQPGIVISKRSHHPLFINNKHAVEGFAMDWSGTVAGR